MLPSIAAVVFDAVGTTMTPQPSVPAAYAAVGRKLGLELASDVIHERFHQAFARQEAIDAERGQHTDEARERLRWHEILCDVFREAASEPLFDALWDYFADPAHWRIYDDVPGVWKSLEDRGLTLCIASNFDARLTDVCRGLPPLGNCQRVFISSLLGARKPGLAFFQAVQRELDLPPEQILMVGDGRTNDFDPALAAGWQAVLIDRDLEQTEPQRLAGGWRIGSLEMLPSLIP